MIDPKIQSLADAPADIILNEVAAEAASASPDVLDDRGKLLILALVAVTREMLVNTASIAASLKSIAASQEVVAAEAKVSMEIVQEGAEPLNPTDARDFHDDVL